MNEVPSLYDVTIKGMGGAVRMIVQGTSPQQVTKQFAAIGIKVYFTNVKSFTPPPSESEGCTPQPPMQPSLF
jgi:hypothetical protein